MDFDSNADCSLRKKKDIEERVIKDEFKKS